MSITMSGDRPPFIFVGGKPAEALEFAAAELRRYLEAVLGVPCSADGSGAVRINLSIDALPELSDEGYEIDTRGRTVSIRGGGPAGVVFGVYEFLRRFAGCRFSGLGPEGEHVPRRASLTLKSGVLRRKPILWYRGLQFPMLEVETLTLQRLDWMAKNGMNYAMLRPRADVETDQSADIDPATGVAFQRDPNEMYSESYLRRVLLPELRKRGLKLDFNHHNLFFWLPPEHYFDKHPEWFALIKGQRTRDRKQLCICTSNREAVAQLIANVLAFLRKTPETSIVGIVPEDDIGMCECEACRALDLDPAHVALPYRGHRSEASRNPSKIRRYTLLLNEIARAVAREFPRVRVSGMAYVDLQWPDPDTKLDPSIIPIVATYWRCAAHPLSAAGCEMNRFFADILQQWKGAHGGKIVLYEYYMGMAAQRGLPFPIWEMICREWPMLRAQGIDGASVQSRSRSHNVYAPNYIAFARCGWEENVSAAAVLDECLEGLFGAAAGALRPIYDAMLRKLQDVERAPADSPFLKYVLPARGCFLPNARNVAYLLPPAERAAVRLQITAARSTAQTDRERRQVERFADAAEFWMWAAEMVEAGQRILDLPEKSDERRAAAREAADRLRPGLERIVGAPLAPWGDVPEPWRAVPPFANFKWFEEQARG